MSQEQYTLTRQELERMLERFAHKIAEHEDHSAERARLWLTMFGPLVLADAGMKK